MTPENLLDALCKQPVTASPVEGGWVGSTLRGVIGVLKEDAKFNALDIILLIPKIVDLIVQYGPVVADIVKKIYELFGK